MIILPVKKIILPIFCALFVLALSVRAGLAKDGDSSGSSGGGSSNSGSSGSSGSTSGGSSGSNDSSGGKSDSANTATASTPKPSTVNLKPVDARNLRDAQEKELEADRKKFELERGKKIEEFKNQREDFKKKLEQERKDLKDKRFEKVVTRLEKITGARREALARLDLIVGKIQSRIDKMKAAGADVSALQTALTACGSVKSAAAAAIADSESKVSTIDFNATNAKDLAKAQVSAIQQSNAALKSYHSCLTGVISQAPKTTQKGATGSAQ